MILSSFSLLSVPLVLAESTTAEVKSSAIGELLVGLAALAVLILAIWSLIDRVKGGTKEAREISPNPLRVQEADVFVTVAHCREMHERIKEEQKEQDAGVDTQLGRERGARKEIHQEITAIKADLSAARVATANLGERVGELKREVCDMGKSIDLVPGRVVNLLKETKGLLE
jgi:hypothetical protein